MSLAQRFHLHDAIVLARYDLADADRIVVFGTPDAGKVSAKVKGAKRLASKLAALIEPGSHVCAQFVEGRSSLRVFTGGQIQSVTPCHTLEAMSVRDHCLEVARASFVEDQQDPVLFDVLRFALMQLGSVSPFLVQLLFDCAAVYALGQTPQLYECLICSCSLVQNGAYLSTTFGGGLCVSCHTKDPSARALSPELFAFWRFMERRFAVLPLSQAMRPSISMSKEQAQEGCNLLHYWLSEALQSSLKTASWQAEVMRLS